MKIVASIFFILFFNQVFADVRIEGELIGMPGVKQIKVNLPVGDYSSINNETFYPVVNNKFSFSFKLTKAVFIQIRAGYKRVFIVACPDDITQIKIFSTTDKYASLKIVGKNAAGQYWYNMYNEQPLNVAIGHGALFDALSAETVDEVLKRLGRFFNSQTIGLDSIYKKGLINAEFLSLVKMDIRSQHVSNIVNRLTYLTNKISDYNTIYKYQQIIKALERFADPQNITHTRGTFGPGLLMNYYSTSVTVTSENTEKTIWGPYGSYLSAPDPIKLYLLGDALLSAKKFGSNEFDFNKAYNMYKTQFPKSPFIQQLNTLKLAAEQYLIAGDVVLDTLHQYNSLQEIKQKFKGRAIYIDLWASWCIPCREEFSYYPPLNNLFKQKSIAPVFISIDNAAAKPQWINLIYLNKLKGYHILANNRLKADIKKLVYKKGQVSIPRYLIIDKTTKVQNWDAPRPSDPALLKAVNKL